MCVCVCDCLCYAVTELYVHMSYIGSGIHFRTTYKIGIEISAASRSLLPILGPCVEQRNTTLYAMQDLDRLLMSEVNPANTKVPKKYYFRPMSCNFGLQAVRR